MTGPRELTGRWLRNINHGCAPFMDSVVLAIHKGCAFETGHIFSGVADGAQASFLLVPSDNQEAHIVLATAAGGLAVWHLYEEPTIVASGTVVGVNNLNRHYGNKKSEWLAFHTPSISDVGDHLKSGIIPGSVAGVVGADIANIRATAERVLCTDHSYLLVVQNQSGGAVLVEVSGEWCEAEHESV